MRNIITFVQDYGSISFQTRPFNEVDSLILSQLSYLNLDVLSANLDENKEAVSLIERLNDEIIHQLCENTLDRKKNELLLHALKNSSRYEGLYINAYQSHFSMDKVEQFYAITFVFKAFIYVAYRGTDLSLLGWYENFNMPIMDVIPSQKDAAKYLKAIAQKMDGPIYLGGHSKGGNLAVYAALYSCSDIRNRIVKIFDHDGPGFATNVFSTDTYKELEDKIEKTTCKEAIVGILLYHSEKMKFVDSRSIGILQHDPFNWKITKDGQFKLVKKAKLISKIFEKTVNRFIETTPLEERKIFLDIVFKMTIESGNEIIFDINRHPIVFAKRIRRNYKKLTVEQKELFKKLLKKYQKMWNENLRYYIHRKIHFKVH